MPQSLRARIEALRYETEARHIVQQGLRELHGQPTAGQTRRLMTLLIACVIGAWIVAFALTAVQGYRSVLSIWSALPALSLPVAVGSLGYSLMCRTLNDRTAFRMLSLGYAARPPVQAGRELRCRACAAPLPDAGQLLQACLYCRADNILATDLLPAVEPSLYQDATSLEKELEARSRSRARWTRLIAISAAAVVAAVLAQGASSLMP